MLSTLIIVAIVILVILAILGFVGVWGGRNQGIGCLIGAILLALLLWIL